MAVTRCAPVPPAPAADRVPRAGRVVPREDPSARGAAPAARAYPPTCRGTAFRVECPTRRPVPPDSANAVRRR